MIEGHLSQLQYPHSLYIPSSLLTETKRAAQFGVLIIPFSCKIYRARFARSLTPQQPQGPGSNSVHSHPALSCLMLWPALVGGQPVLVCDTERKPKSFSTFPPGPLLGSSWSLPCNAPLSQRPSQSSTATVKCTVTVSAGAGIPSPAQPSPCPLANSAGYARPSCAGYTWQPQFPAIMRLGAAGAIPTSGRPASLVDIVQSSPSFKTQKIMWSSSTIISLCKEHEECVVG